MTALSRVVRVPDDEYQPAAALPIPALSIARYAGDGGTASLSSGTQPFASGTASVAFGFTPGQVVVSAHDGNTVATVQSWSSSGFTVTEAKFDYGVAFTTVGLASSATVPAGGGFVVGADLRLTRSVLGTVGFSWIAME